MRGFGLKFRLFGFPVIFDPGFFILVAVLLLFNKENIPFALTIIGCILVSVMVHEFGHAVVGRIYGLQPSIRMTMLGGLTQWGVEKGKNPSNFQHILITLAGPFAGFALGGLVLAYCVIMQVPYSFTLAPASTTDILLLFNFFWGLANLLPLYPLDGGQVLYYSLRSNKSLPAEQISAYTSLALGGAILIWAGLEGRLILVFILLWLLSENFQRIRRAASPPKREEVIDHARKITQYLNDRKFVEGLKAASDLMRTTSEERVRSWATEMAAVFLDLSNDPATTLEYLRENRRYLSSSDAIRFLRLKAEDDRNEAMAFGQRALYARPSLTLLAVYAAELIRSGDFPEAARQVMEQKDSSWFGQLAAYTQLQMLLHGGDRESIELGKAALETEGSPEVAYNIGAAYAKLDNAASAIQWLEDAIRRGYSGAETMANDQDLQSLRDHHGFQDLLEQLRVREMLEKAEKINRQSLEPTGEDGNTLPLGRESQK